MNKSLTRSIGFWLLLVVSLISAGVGGWVISGQLGTMTTTLLDGTATGIEVYVGQSLVVVGAALLGAGVLGILLSLGLSAVQSVLPTPVPTAAESIEPTSEEADASAQPLAHETAGETVPETDGAKVQNGSSGSTATATKISVR